MKKILILLLLFISVASAQQTLVRRAELQSTINDSLNTRLGANWVTPEMYGATGDGVVDDTDELQNALDSGVPTVRGLPGHTYLVDGGLTMSTAGQVLIMTGATIKLKDNATSNGMLTIEADSCVIDGGTWDGNRTNGNSDTQWNSWAIYIDADYCTVKNTSIKDVYGNSIFIDGSYNNINNNKFKNYFFCGVYSETGTLAPGDIDHISAVITGYHYYNTVNNNYFNGATGGEWSTGISIHQNIGHQIKDNVIISTTNPDSIYSSGISSLFGKFAAITGNITQNGVYGITLYLDSSIVSNNQCNDLLANSYGVEIDGSGNIVNGNIITQAQNGILMSTTRPDIFDGNVFSGNIISSKRANASGMFLWSDTTISNTVINNNYFSTPKGIVAQNISGIKIFGNMFDSTAYGIEFDADTTWNIDAVISGNSFINQLLSPVYVYSIDGDTVDYIFMSNNFTDGAGSSFTIYCWTAILGDNIVYDGNISKTDGLVSNATIVTDSIQVTGTADVDSLYIRSNIGIGTYLPSTILDLRGAPNAVLDPNLKHQLTIKDNSTAYNLTPTGGIHFSNIYNSGGNLAGMGGITVFKENTTDGNYAGALALYTRANGGDIAEQLRITSAGDVGIGTASPSAKLDVNGTANLGATTVSTLNVGTITSTNGRIQPAAGGQIELDSLRNRVAKMDTISFGLGITDAADGSQSIAYFTTMPITITRTVEVLRGVATSDDTAKSNIYFSTDISSGSPNTLWTTDKNMIDSTIGTHYTSFNDATIPAYSWIWLQCNDEVGTVNQLNVTVYARKD